MKRIHVLALCVSLISAILLAGCGAPPSTPRYSYVPTRYESAPTAMLLTAEYTDVAPQIDGVTAETEDAWASAAPLQVKLGSAGAEYLVDLKSAYDDNNLYLTATWKDESPNISGRVWETREGGGWKSGTMLPKQDMLSLGFEATPVKDFDKQGCQVICHDNTYQATPNLGEFLDMWVWMAAETGQLGYANNYSIGAVAPSIDPKAEDFETRSAWHYMTGSLYPNKRNARSPRYIPKPTIPYSLLVFGDLSMMEDAPVDPTNLPAGVKAPYYMKNPGTTDIACVAKYNEEAKTWTVEMKRSLVTSNPNQVQFAHNPADGGFYLFGLSLFDNQMGVSHVYTIEAITLEFSGK